MRRTRQLPGAHVSDSGAVGARETAQRAANEPKPPSIKKHLSALASMSMKSNSVYLTRRLWPGDRSARCERAEASQHQETSIRIGVKAYSEGLRGIQYLFLLL